MSKKILFVDLTIVCQLRDGYIFISLSDQERDVERNPLLTGG